MRRLRSKLGSRSMGRPMLMLTRVHRRLPELYLVFALAMTCLLALLTAPFFAPDEAHQAARALALSHGEWMAVMGSTEAGGQIDANALRVMDGMDAIRMKWERRNTDFHDRSYGAVSAADQLPLGRVRWAHRSVFAPFPNTAAYPPTLYLPAMLGWRVGEAADLSIFASLRLARLLCAVTSVVVGWLALRVCVGPRWLLLGFLLLPSTLFLNASCSQDAVLLSVAALFAALLTLPLAAGREFATVELVTMAALLSVCATARLPYLTLSVLLFLPGLEVCRWSHRWLRAAAAFAFVVLITGFWRHMVSPFGFDEADQADPGLQGIFLRAHPVLAGWALCKGTVEAAADFVRRGTYVLGWNDLLPHHGVAAVLLGCLVVLQFAAPASPLRTWPGRALLAAAVLGSLLGISLAEYIIWTPPGWPTVYGIQPRYWLPVMPLGVLLLGSFRKRPDLRDFSGEFSGVQSWLLPGATAVLALVACTLPWMAAHAFYGESVGRVLLLNLR